MKKKLIRISKFLSLILRHKPEIIGLSLDQNGWVSVQSLIDAVNAHDHSISRQLIDEVVFTNDKMRFSFSPDGMKIRANQGHSLDVNLGLKPMVPPEILYHGTTEKFIHSIKISGLQKMKRQYVHLSATIETALSAGSRRGKPVVLSIKSGGMHEDGHQFFLSENGVWLTETVEVRYLTQILPGGE